MNNTEFFFHDCFICIIKKGFEITNVTISFTQTNTVYPSYLGSMIISIVLNEYNNVDSLTEQLRWYSKSNTYFIMAMLNDEKNDVPWTAEI